MTKFANYKNGALSINTYRLADAEVTTVPHIALSALASTDEVLTASINTDAELNAVETLIHEMIA